MLYTERNIVKCTEKPDTRSNYGWEFFRSGITHIDQTAKRHCSSFPLIYISFPQILRLLLQLGIACTPTNKASHDNFTFDKSPLIIHVIIRRYATEVIVAFAVRLSHICLKLVWFMWKFKLVMYRGIPWMRIVNFLDPRGARVYSFELYKTFAQGLLSLKGDYSYPSKHV